MNIFSHRTYLILIDHWTAQCGFALSKWQPVSDSLRRKMKLYKPLLIHDLWRKVRDSSRERPSGSAPKLEHLNFRQTPGQIQAEFSSVAVIAQRWMKLKFWHYHNAHCFRPRGSAPSRRPRSIAAFEARTDASETKSRVARSASTGISFHLCLLSVICAP